MEGIVRGLNQKERAIVLMAAAGYFALDMPGIMIDAAGEPILARIAAFRFLFLCLAVVAAYFALANAGSEEERQRKWFRRWEIVATSIITVNFLFMVLVIATIAFCFSPACDAHIRDMGRASPISSPQN